MLSPGVEMGPCVLGSTAAFTEPIGNKSKGDLEGVDKLIVQETGVSEVRQ